MRRVLNFLFAAAILGVTPAPACALEIQLFRPRQPDEITRVHIERFRSAPELRAAGITVIEMDLAGNVRDVLSGEQVRLALVSLDTLLVSGLVGNSPLVSSFMQPSQFPNDDALFRTQDLAPGEALLAEVGREGSLVPIAYWSRGQTAFLSRGPINTANDFSGKKFRSAFSAVADAPANVFGLTALRLPAAEVTVALQRGLFDSAELTSTTALTLAPTLPETGMRSAVTNYRPVIGFLVANSRGWDQLKEREKAAIAAAAKAADDAARQASKQIAARLEANLRSQNVTLVNLALSDSANVNRFNAAHLTTQFGERDIAAVRTVQAIRDLTILRSSVTPPVPAERPLTLATQPPVVFITDRDDEGGNDPATRFASSAAPDPSLVCGQVGYVTSTARTIGTEYSGPITLTPATLPTGRDACAGLIIDALQRSGRSRVLLFIHGFNNTFDFAVRRAITTGLDIGFDGIILVWSWPSEGRAQAYMRDETTSRRTSRFVPPFIATLVARQQVQRLDVLAHSMGSRIALALLDELRKMRLARINLGTIIFAAADEDRAQFVDVIRDTVRDTPALGRIRAIYAAKYDQPLQISALLHHGDRVGVGGNTIMITPGVESIDATDVEGGFWAAAIKSSHAHVFDVPKAIADLKRLLANDLSANRRGLQEHTSAAGTKYWSIPN